MIPAWNTSGILPPFIGAEPTSGALMSPYVVRASHVVDRFATSLPRITILRGWLQFRADLRLLGIDRGFQWLDGSFVEHCEAIRGRPPKDLDLVTFGNMPVTLTGASQATIDAFILANMNLFSPLAAKAHYGCHSFFVELEMRPENLINFTRFYYGFFSHQRVTGAWKGMANISLNSDDAAATALLDQRETSYAPQT